jgi:hypothetical protein
MLVEWHGQSAIADVRRLDAPSFDTAELAADAAPLTVVPAVP